MHAVKVFVLLALTSFATFLTSSFFSNEDETFEVSFERANAFFSVFGSSVADKLQQISAQLAGVDELSSVCPSILSFSMVTGEQLFSEVMVNFHNEDHIYETFLIFFNDTIGLEFDNIKRRLHSSDEYDFDPYIDKFASDLKDAIVSSLKFSLSSVSAPEIQRPMASTNFKSIAENDGDDFDEITVEFSKPVPLKDENSVPKQIEIKDEDNMINSSRSNSPKVNPDLAFEAMSILFYGIRSGHALFPFAKAYLQFLQENNLKLFNPNSLFDTKNARLALNRNFDIGNPVFLEFCNYVKFSIIPITSPLYHGPIVSKSKVSEVRKSILTDLAVKKMQYIVVNFNYDEMISSIQIKHPEIELEIIECFISHIKEQAYNFLLSLDTKISFPSGLKTTIEAAYQNISDVFCLSNDPKFSKTIIETFLSIFESPLALIKRYDDLEDWKSIYDENSPTYKPRILSPIDESRNSGRKSVKIVEENNEVCIINRVADIEREFIEKENIVPIKRSPTKSSNLSDLVEIDMLDRSLSPLSIFEDKVPFFKNLRPIPTIPKVTPTKFELEPIHKEAPFSANNPSVFKKIQKRANRFSSSEVPDFPFLNPSEIVEYPEFITYTGDYLLEHGDNSCFMLDERIYSMKEGISAFLSESFEDKKTVELVMKTFEKSLEKVFKS